MRRGGRRICALLHYRHRLAQSLLRRHVEQLLDFTTINDPGEDIAIEQVPVAPSNRMVSKTIREMQIGRDVAVIVKAIRNRDGAMVSIHPRTRPYPGATT